MSAQPEIPPVVVIEPTTSGENTVAVATPVDQSAKAVKRLLVIRPNVRKNSGGESK